MLSDAFLGRRISHFRVNGVVRTFIFSETLVWSAWNFVLPIVAIFAITNIPKGNVEIAASTYSLYLIVRMICELATGKFLPKHQDRMKYIFTIWGVCLISLGYVLLIFTKTIDMFYLSYITLGLGMGISSPAKSALFSTHLDPNKEAIEWGIYDAAVLTGMAVSGALGGFIANHFGFKLLFCLAASINILGIIPYLIYAKSLIFKK